MPKNKVHDALVVESAWEVCNQVGGIYTVLRSKAPSMQELWDENYCLVGPYFSKMADGEFEPSEDYSGPFGAAVLKLRELGFEAYFGRWLVSGKPKVVLINPFSCYHMLGEIKYLFYEHHHISMNNYDELRDQVVAFGHLVKLFLSELAREQSSQHNIIAHFHEWMVGTAIPEIRREQIPVTTVFTTHATLLGRYLAMNDPDFYGHLPFIDWQKEAKHFNIEASVQIERAAAHGSHIFSTVSRVTAKECIHLLGRKPDAILPNGLNIQRFTALHEFQNLHQEYKEKIHQFVIAHFFQSYDFDLDNTLYFFTSGRYEYRNKGYDLTLEALARLNYRMKQEGIDTTVIMFFITKQPYHSINPDVLQSRAVMEELRETCEAIKNQIGERLFYTAAAGKEDRLPQMNDFVEEYWRLRYRRTLQSWKTDRLPFITTHNLINDGKDDILNFLRTANLVNNKEDKVKVVYHPDFISSTNPLFHMDYGQFVRGCHMGIFPSYYEPWGYTPLECIARGVPTVTSDLSGFGDYVMEKMPDIEKKGIHVVKRKNKNFDEAADDLAKTLLSFVKLTRRKRIMQRNIVESSSVNFDWKRLRTYYEEAYEEGLNRVQSLL